MLLTPKIEATKQEELDKQIACFVATDNLPLSAVTKRGFQTLLSHLCPDHLEHLVVWQRNKDVFCYDCDLKPTNVLAQ